MQRKQKFLIIFIILDILTISFFLSFAAAPQLYLKNKLFVSETLEPPANFELQLNSGHNYYLEFHVYPDSPSNTYDIVLYLKIDNSTFHTTHLIPLTKYPRGHLGPFYVDIPVSSYNGGFFEIIVGNSEEIACVEYSIYQDVPDFILNLNTTGEGFAFFFIVILVLCLLWNKEELQPLIEKLKQASN